MSVRDIMTTNPACCTPDTTIQQVARMMAEHDCGEIPVLDGQGRVQGVVTDRDICCRGVAEGANCAQMPISEVMTSPAVTVTADMSLQDCCNLMEEHMIRRVPVVDQSGCCCGIVSQADFAVKTDGSIVDELVREISTPSHAPANL
jgi:CBS domain-containing protein